jgi:hypothetical protein
LAVAAWEPRPDRFDVTPVYASGEHGLPLNLTSLFEAYNSATEAGEDAEG